MKIMIDELKIGGIYHTPNTVEIDLDDLYNRYEYYKTKIINEPIDSDYEPIMFSAYAGYYITKIQGKGKQVIEAME
jgi:hypothetical protein